MPAKTILVVDDSATERLLVSSALQPDGYRILTASDGVEGVAKAAAEKPDLIVLDVVMPNQNGFQVCRTLKTEPATSGIKVLMLTSKGGESDKFWAKRQGADSYLTKPFNPTELAACVADLLAR